MSKTISIKLKKVQYGGDSIGRDVRIETDIQGRFFAFDKTITRGSTVEINHAIAGFTVNEPLNAQLEVKVIEKDRLFKDTGQNSVLIQFDPQNQTVQEFTTEVRVREWNRIFRKSTAIFTLTFQVQAHDGLMQYLNYGKENYNQYDNDIRDVVNYWNGEFAKDTDPPKELLDPNLVKAILYQESRVGNDPTAGINIMQVGNPGDPSLKTLRGELPEYWIHDGEQILLQYDAKVEKAKDSIYWGVRWLYHKAQGITTDRRRYWNGWKQAVHGYGPGTQQYTDSVWDIYTHGFKLEKKKKIKLWMIIFLLLVMPSLVFGWIAANQGKTYITFEDIESTKDYRFYALVLDGLWFKKIQLGINYDNAGNWFALDKDKTIAVNYLDIDNDGQSEIIISGPYFDGSIKYLLKREYSGYRIVYNESEYGDISPAFRDQKVEFKNLGADDNLEVATYFLVPYLNAPDQLWTKYYYYDWDGVYKFYKKYKTDCPCPFAANPPQSELKKYISNSSE